MRTGDEDNSWEEVYRSCGVRCDIDIEESIIPTRDGVCPAPLANPLCVSNTRLERWMEADGVPEDVYA
jgi:hypothetical protein